MSSNQANPKSHIEQLASGSAWYAKHGWKILPCYGLNNGGRCTCGGSHTEPKDVGKHPAIGEWQNKASSDEYTVRTWWENQPENNVAVACKNSGLVVIDIDPRSGGIESFEKFQELLNYDLPQTVEALTGKYVRNGVEHRGRHIFFKCSPDEKLIGNLKNANLPGIDIKHNGYVMLAPSRHGSGVNYEWVEGHAPWQIEVADAPDSLMKTIRKGGSRSSMALGDTDWNWVDGLDFGSERVEIAKMLEEGIDEGSRAVDVYKLACAIANKFGVDTPEKRLMIETMMIRFNHEKIRPPLNVEGPNGILMHTRRAMDFVADNPVAFKISVSPELGDWVKRNQAETLATKGAGFANAPKVSTSAPRDEDENDLDSGYIGTIGNAISQAARSGQSINDAFRSGNIDIPKDPDAITEAEGGTPGKRSLSDVGNGRRLVDTFGSSCRYSPGIGWHIWDGEYWKPDAEDLGMQELAKKLAPIIATEVVHYSDPDKQAEVVKWANQAKSNGRLKAAIESCNSDPRVVIGVDVWDNNVYMLGVANGVVDLRTGELLRGRPDLHITKRTAVAYTQGMTNARWKDYLDFATGGDKELQDWLQRAVGYTLTGLNTQDVMFLVYGPPGSGKNTFVETIVKALDTKQYAWPLDSSILAQGDGQASSTDLYHWAELRGKRMVWVDELPDSERMKENSVKKLTGSSEISARSPGEKPFTFQSQAKLWVTTNHRPMINDDAMWRRLRPIPWTNVPENPDPDLKAYLHDPEGALPAVLAWAVEGAIKYLNSNKNDPLGWCAAITEAHSIYRQNEDRMGLFLSEETCEAPGTSVKVKSIYLIYRNWAQDRGEKPMTQTSFNRKLVDRGLTIEGAGASAKVLNYQLMEKSESEGSGIDWSVAERIARF